MRDEYVNLVIHYKLFYLETTNIVKKANYENDQNNLTFFNTHLYQVMKKWDNILFQLVLREDTAKIVQMTVQKGFMVSFVERNVHVKHIVTKRLAVLKQVYTYV